MTPGPIPSIIRRRLRRGLGSRTQRRMGCKSHPKLHQKPRERLRQAIEAWRAQGCPEVPSP